MAHHPSSSMSASYKPSPLSFGSPSRALPFRRPESPASPTPTVLRPSTPNASPSKPLTPSQTPSKLQNAITPSSSAIKEEQWPSSRDMTPTHSPTRNNGPSRSQSALNTLSLSKSLEESEITAPATTRPSWSRQTTAKAPIQHNTSTTSLPTLSSTATTTAASPKFSLNGPTNDTISKLPPPLLRSLQESFSILDRHSTGTISRDDISETLSSLGLDNSTSSVSPFFPPSAAQSLTLPSYLQTLSSLLVPLSSQQELMSAFSAFDADDSGQVDVKELRDALLNTAPDREWGGRGLSEREIELCLDGFVGRREFTTTSSLGRGMNTGGGVGKGEVFRYADWVGNLMGGSAGGGEQGKGEEGIAAK
ncbi:hypothetical protein MMC25_001487 [Agyrium rufum]|nr:hypothetical protein [Agyrium rufum]